MAVIQNPKYDNDYVTLGYLKSSMETNNTETNKKINEIPKNYNSPPVPPYYVNSLLVLNGQIYKCVKSRLIGSFTLSDWELAVETNDISESLKAIYDVNKLEYVEQKDGLIETFYQADDPSLNWETDLEKESHESDLWHDLSETYQYVKKATNPITYKWVKRNVPVSLFDIIDGYKQIFLKEPTNYKKGDLWFGDVTKIAIENSDVFNGEHWEVRDDYVEAFKTEKEEYHTIYVLPNITEIDRQTLSEIKKAIDEITLTVSQTYTTKTELNTYIDGVKSDISKEYTSKTDFLAQIDITAQQIDNVVSQTTENSNKIVEVTHNINNIQNLFQITGGNNLIKNSVGFFKDENWIKSENGIFEFGEGSDLIGKTTSRAKISISNGRLTTSSSNIVDLTLNEQKTLNFKAKQDENTTTTITLYGLDENNPLYSKTFTEAFDWQEVFTPEENQFFIDSPNLTLVINSTSTYDGKFYISDLMLNNGDKTEWQLSRGEVSSTTIKMTQDGITVYMNTKNIATLLNADGLQIRKLNGNLIGDIVTEFNSDGIFTKNIEHTGQYVQKNYVRDVTMYNGFETYFDYIRG